MIEIKSWVDGKVLYTAENAQDVRAALEEAVKAKADLGFANLRSANLRSADLGSADLGSANLGSADLGSANLRFADLGSANLRFADLGSADLGSADLGFANLRSANLGSANLRFADLGSADLGSANLRFADLGSADLGSANLRFADLGSANLRFADLGSANLRSADLGSADLRSAIDGPRHPLWIFRQDYWSILDQAPAEVATLRKQIVAGKINGSVYEDDCGLGCLNGTIAIAHGCKVDDLKDELGIEADASRPAEQWFIAIKKGDKPLPLDTEEWPSESVFRASYALSWLDEWVKSREAVAVGLGFKKPKRRKASKKKS